MFRSSLPWFSQITLEQLVSTPSIVATVIHYRHAVVQWTLSVASTREEFPQIPRYVKESTRYANQAQRGVKVPPTQRIEHALLLVATVATITPGCT
jgi:hypothetical protein